MKFDESNNNWFSVKGRRGASNASLLTVMDENLWRCRFCVSSLGSFLMAISLTRIGDFICVLAGCDAPVLIREREKDYYIFI
jgi:hypothetical protein